MPTNLNPGLSSALFKGRLLTLPQTLDYAKRPSRNKRLSLWGSLVSSKVNIELWIWHLYYKPFLICNLLMSKTLLWACSCRSEKYWMGVKKECKTRQLTVVTVKLQQKSLIAQAKDKTHNGFSVFFYLWTSRTTPVKLFTVVINAVWKASTFFTVNRFQPSLISSKDAPLLGWLQALPIDLASTF
jgi:hypothetical protein